MKIYSILFIFFPIILFSQMKIKGSVINEEGKGINAAKVYLDGSTFQVLTDTNGEFELDVPAHNYQLIVQKDLYESAFVSILKNTNQKFKITLYTEEIHLKEAVVSALNKEDRTYFLNQFKNLFLGRKSAAELCKILNEDDLRISFRTEERILKVSSKKPILIQNQFLGYHVEYNLVHFEYDYSTGILSILGSSNFKEMKGSDSKLKKWKLNRSNSYNGSVEHFMKSLYQNNLADEGFDVKRLVRKENPDYLKFKEEFENSLSRIKINKPIPPKIISYLINQPVPIDSLVTEKNQLKYLNFNGLYSVEYLKGKEDVDYAKKNNKNGFKSNQISVFSIHETIQLFADGTYYHPENLLVEGYWSYKKMADLLPIDYILSQ